MTNPDFRRYTTQELRDMPDTARLEDRKGRVWRVQESQYGNYWVDADEPPRGVQSSYQLARRLLRRIA